MQLLHALFIAVFLLSSCGRLASEEQQDSDPWLIPNGNDIKISAFGKFAHRVEGMLGIEYIVPRNDNSIGNYVRNFGHYEMQYWQMVKEIAQMHVTIMGISAPIVFLDIGANIGTWSLPFARFIGTTGYVYAIDAQQQMNKYLSAAAILNGFANIRIKNAIVSNETNKVSVLYDIVTEKGKTVNYGEHPIENMAHRENHRSSDPIYGDHSHFAGLAVQHVTLNGLYYQDRAFSCPSVLKMDIECHEIDALIGGMKMLADCMPILFVEAQCEVFLLSMFTILDKLGYSIFYAVSSSLPFFFGRVVNFDLNFDVNSILYTGPNVIAVPKNESLDVLGKYSDLLVLVDNDAIQSGKIYLRDFNVEVCTKIWTVYDKIKGAHQEVLNPHLDLADLENPFPGFQDKDIYTVTSRKVCTVLEQHTDCGCPNKNPFLVDFWKELF